MINGILWDVAIIILVATAGSLLMRMIKQPLIPAYIIAGIIIGPHGLALIRDYSNVMFFAEIGIAFLLFVVGLELGFKRLKTIGFMASVGGTLLTFVVFIIGLIVAMFLGFVHYNAIYLALILAFSSTLVVVKLLSDKKEIDTLHGRIVIGLLLVQDVIAILALSALTSLNGFTPLFLVIALAKGVGLLLAAVVGSKYLFPRLFKFAAESPDLLLLTSLAVVFLFSLLSMELGFSLAIGGFIAGIALANLPYNFEIISRIKSLRDFFATIFFVSLGMEMMWGMLGELYIPILVLLAFVIFIRPILTIILGNYFGYATRTSFLSALSTAQTSEFSLIIVTQGLLLGHISQNIFTIAVVVAVVTMSLTAYFIKYDDTIHSRSRGILKIFDRIGKARHLEYMPEIDKYDIILVGCDRIGHSILDTFQKIKKKVFVVDFNPDVIRKLINEKVPCMYGDISDLDIINRLNLKGASMVIMTFPDVETNTFVIKKMKQANKKALMIVTASKVDEALALYEKGADYVILPHFLGGTQVSFLLQDTSVDIKNLLKAKLEHIKELHGRRKLGHEHPKHHH